MSNIADDSSLIPLNDEKLEALLAGSVLAPTALILSIPDCEPCRMLKSALDRLALEPRLRDIDFCVYGNDLREVRYMFLKGFRKFPQLRLFNQGKLLLELESLKLGGDGELEEDFASLLISCFFPALSS